MIGQLFALLVFALLVAYHQSRMED